MKTTLFLLFYVTLLFAEEMAIQNISAASTTPEEAVTALDFSFTDAVLEDSLPITEETAIMDGGDREGNGGGIIKTTDGNIAPADLYLDIKNEELPSSYHAFSFNDYPEMRDELQQMINFLNSRYIKKPLIDLTLNDFSIYFTDKLLQEIKYDVIPAVSFESVTFTYIHSQYNFNTFSSTLSRVIELKKDGFDQLSSHHQALLLLHEILHHVRPEIYNQISNRYVLLSSLVKNLDIIWNRHLQQKSGHYYQLTSEELEASKIIQIILARYDSASEEYIQSLAVSNWGGISNNQDFSENNKIALDSVVMLNADTGIREVRDNKINGSNIKLVIFASVNDGGEEVVCKNNRFSDLKLNRNIRLHCHNLQESIIEKLYSTAAQDKADTAIMMTGTVSIRNVNFQNVNDKINTIQEFDIMDSVLHRVNIKFEKSFAAILNSSVTNSDLFVGGEYECARGAFNTKCKLSLGHALKNAVIKNSNIVAASIYNSQITDSRVLYGELYQLNLTNCSLQSVSRKQGKRMNITGLNMMSVDDLWSFSSDLHFNPENAYICSANKGSAQLSNYKSSFFGCKLFFYSAYCAKQKEKYSNVPFCK